MPKRVVEHHYITAFQILLVENWFSVDPCDCYDDSQFPLYSKAISAEKQYLKKERYEQLSSEAKEIITAVSYTHLTLPTKRIV